MPLNVGTYDAEIRPEAWFDPCQVGPEGWFDNPLPFEHDMMDNPIPQPWTRWPQLAPILAQ